MSRSGNNHERLVMIIRYLRLLKLLDVIPSKAVNALPTQSETIEPKLMIDISRAYMVPSIFLGHNWQAIMSIGSNMISPRHYYTKLSLKQNI